ncbi:hypothetical protein [Caballeronia sp. PC1]|uniref:hypothetical protein n=1 Tax=Caballeronia sp. PC1 TaxID=2906765 RepID=UPI001F24B234|nr:hypothetical protein [Caballeronia sp. PC1]MCE4548085.1 hypothetical protein [Caballeronia sp. PC1]
MTLSATTAGCARAFKVSDIGTIAANCGAISPFGDAVREMLLEASLKSSSQARRQRMAERQPAGDGNRCRP